MAKISLGRYMWERLHQLGVDSIFGVPGDFNLQFLDSIYDVKDLKMVPNQNELNAAYAADGYSRIKGVPGCLVTTHGVGELSALNGIAGSMSEHVGIVHVVGQTTRTMQSNHMMIHHSIGQKPDHQQYNKASEPLRYAAAGLWDVKTAPAEIDRVLRECFIKSGPVYIFLPLDLSAEMVDAELLETPIDLEPYIDTTTQIKAVNSITAAIKSAKHPIILADALVKRFNVSEETIQLTNQLGVPSFSTSMGKGIMDEVDEMYVGVWNGAVSTPGVVKETEKSDLVITLGYLPADTNSGGFSRNIKTENWIRIDPFQVTVKGKTYSNVPIKPLLKALLQALPSGPQHKIAKARLPPPRVPRDENETRLTQSYIWPSMSSFLRPNDIIIGETGTSNFGIYDIAFPANVRYEAQIYYGSIGWAAAATLGVDIARTELEAIGKRAKGRTVLFTGDGSLALTIQEVGTMIKQKCKCVIFVINNEGYTVERMIWGARQPYNDIVPTTYSHLLPLYQHPSPSTSYHRVTTKRELDAVLAKPEVQDPRYLQLVELVVDKMDTSWRLGTQLAWRGKESQDYLTREGFVDTYGGWGLEEGAGMGTVSWK